MKYKETQIGWYMSILLIVAILMVSTGYFLGLGSNPISMNGLLIVGSILLLSLLSFYKLTVKIENKTIHIIYGIGLIRIRLRIQNLKYAKVIKTPFYIGLGIRVTSTGMLYNIQGSKAVEVKYGINQIKRVKIGANNPTMLKEAIETHFKDEFSNG